LNRKASLPWLAPSLLARLAWTVPAVVLAVFVALCGSPFARSAAAAQPGMPTLEPPEASGNSGETLDRQTPRRTMDGFLREAKEGDFRVAASYLDLRGIAASTRDEDGPELAQKLGFVLERRRTLDLSKIPDTPEGTPGAKAADRVVVDTLYAGEAPVPIELARVRFPDGVDRWLIAQATVSLSPVVDAAYGPRPIGVHLPASLTRPTFLGNELWQWIGLGASVFLAYIFGRALAALLVRTGNYFAKRTPTQVDNALVDSTRRPLRAIFWAFAYRILLGPLQLSAAIVEAAEHLTYTVLVIGITWLILSAIGVSSVILEERAARESYDVFAGRRVRTQAVLLERVAGVTIIFVSGAVVLLQFDFVRSVGLSLLASAGVLGVVFGVAAQRSLGAIIGGIQFSVAQPVRMADQVVVEGEFGEIEEINLTYVVVRLWDKRRLIVPSTYFLEKPFQNWTRTASDLVGSVIIKVEYGFSIDSVRAELRRMCEADPLWDKKTCSVQATDSDARWITLRALVSASDADKLWDLRCRVREQLLAFLHAQSTAAAHAQAAAPARTP
jgi:small-conductance mechanosensitive channel